MTITVTHRGTPPREKLYTATCRECTSSFTFHMTDTTIGNDRNATFYTIGCPVCKYEIYMSNPKEVNVDSNGKITAKYL